MNKKNLPKNRKTKILKIIIIAIAFTAVIFLLYPSFVNIRAGSRQSDILSEWEAERTFSVEETALAEGKNTEKDAGSKASEENKESKISEFGNVYEGNGKEEAADPASQENSNAKESDPLNGLAPIYKSVAVIEFWDKHFNRKPLDYSILTAEDFFPLKIIIPKIEIEWIVNEGTDTQALKEGPGHIPQTPLPGDIGRCTISGHRTTYGAPFNKVDRLTEGDFIYLETIKNGTFIYAVTGQSIVKPTDVYVLEGTDKRELLLTSCYPEYRATERIIILAELINIFSFELLTFK